MGALLGELASIPDNTHHHFGKSLVAAARNPSSGHREYLFTEAGFTVAEEAQLERPAFPYDLKGELQHRDPSLVGRCFAVRDSRWTYIERLYEPPELFDRAADPGERFNLAGAPDVQEVESRMRARLITWLEETMDVIPLVEDPRIPDVHLPSP